MQNGNNGDDMKKGFTLAELLGVIALLGIIALVTFPPLVNNIKESKQKIDEGNLNLVITAYKSYLTENSASIIIEKNKDYCIKLRTLVDDGKLNNDLKDSNNNVIDIDRTYLKINKNNDYTYELINQNTFDIMETSNNSCEIIKND